MKSTFLARVFGLMVALFLAWPAQAAMIMPDFANVPTGWTKDRYEPNSFSNVGTYQGRNDVLGIGISSADGLSSRPAAYQSQFYNTQGRQHVVSGGAGSVLSADLYIPAAWRDGGSGNVRTDMWGVMTNGASVSDYPIIGFTNYGGAARLRIWDDETLAGWVDLSTPINYDAWTSFSIEFTGASYVYEVNGVTVYTDNTANGSTGFSAVIQQAFNFCGDPSLQGAVCKDYTAHWANSDASQVPTPASLPLVALALLMLSVMTWKRRPGASLVPIKQ